MVLGNYTYIVMMKNEWYFRKNYHRSYTQVHNALSCSRDFYCIPPRQMRSKDDNNNNDDDDNDNKQKRAKYLRSNVWAKEQRVNTKSWAKTNKNTSHHASSYLRCPKGTIGDQI